VGTISLQAAVHPKCTLGALNVKEEEEGVQIKIKVTPLRYKGEVNVSLNPFSSR